MVQYIRAERGCIELLILAQLGHIGVQQMAVVHGMQQEFALPAALLHGKAQLRKDQQLDAAALCTDILNALKEKQA